MGLGEIVIFIVVVGLFVYSSKRTSSRRRDKGMSSDDIARLREMQEWDRISYGEDKNVRDGK